MKHLLFAISFFASAFAVQAQSISFSYFGDTYTDLVGSTSVNNGMTWDDPQFTVPIGFSFQYFQTTLDHLYITDDGYGGLIFSDSLGQGSFAVLEPYGADIIDRGSAGAGTISLSPISYKLEGVTGSRIFKLEWKNVGFYSELFDDNVSTDYTNFQLWLYEGSNDFEVRFGPTSVTQDSISYDGDTGPAVAFYPEINSNTGDLPYGGFNLVGSPNFPGIETVTSFGTRHINGTIPEGMVYHFDNASVAAQEIADAKFDMTFFPNPCTDLIQLKLDQSHASIKEINITNTAGQIVKQIEGNVSKVQVSDLEAGTYFLTVRSKTQSVTKKLIKL